MESRTEEFLNLLFWTADSLMRPTFRNWTESYESWVYSSSFRRQLARLEQQRLLERDPGSPHERLYRLTAMGRLLVLGGRDPSERWARPWDGQWRMVVFDVPVQRNSERQRLRRYLRERGFGCLQQSVWITPDPMVEETQILADGKIDVGLLVLLEARPCAGESDAQIVTGAWDFTGINARYARYLAVVDQKPIRAIRNETSMKTLLRWASLERKAWLAAVRKDPLLPGRILPAGYLGQKAWRGHLQVLRELGRRAASFLPG